jgi:DNA-binding transcriptional LysR family regulator
MRRETDKFHLMRVFHEVAIKGSFTKAAEALGMKVSSVSKAVQQLETSLKTRLLHRTTRSQSLTDSGREYLLIAHKVLAEIKDLEERLLREGNEPSGRLRIAAPTALGQFLIGPKLHQFSKAYPQIKIDLVLSEKVMDITEQGIDLAIRSLFVPKMSQLYCTKLGSHTRKLVASPEYLAKISVLENPEQLQSLNLLNHPGSRSLSIWSFHHGKSQVDIEPNAFYSSNSYYALYQGALNSMGVANLYQYLVDDDIKRGNLVELLPHWQQKERDLYAVFQQRRDTSPKLDVFLSFMSGLFV